MKNKESLLVTPQAFSASFPFNCQLCFLSQIRIRYFPAHSVFPGGNDITHTHTQKE